MHKPDAVIASNEVSRVRPLAQLPQPSTRFKRCWTVEDGVLNENDCNNFYEISASE
jgi:hypothetical protein